MSVFDYLMKNFSINSTWFTGQIPVRTFQLEELLATKLRALYQRKKGRDVFDLWLALKLYNLDISKIILAFQQYMHKENNTVTRLMFEENLSKKLQEHSFLDDIGQLLTPELNQTHSSPRITTDGNLRVTEDGKQRATEGWNLLDAADEIKNKILIHLPK